MKRELQESVSTIVIAIIYCRVSSVAQMQKGHGIGSQETRCREYARMKGYTVESVFKDEAVSGSLIDRPGMQDALAHLRKNRRKARYVLLIDDISRLARDIRAHLELRTAIAETGAALESPSIEFGEDSDAILVEHLLAVVSHHQRGKNAEQTMNRMRARISAGYWPFISPMGLKHEFKPGEGRVLVRDEPIASIIQEALEGYASGLFQTQSEVKRFLESRPAFPKDGRGLVRNQLVNDLLTKPLYAGYVEAPADWGVPLRKGRHEGLISFETFERIQYRLRGGSYAPARADLNEDFPLRGTLACAHCGKALTACWSTGKSGVKHPYYYCFAKGCERKGKTMRRDQVEGAFRGLLAALTPSPRLFELAHAMFRDAWNQRTAQALVIAKGYAKDLTRVEGEIAKLLDRIVDASSPTVIGAYERRIGELEREKLVLEERQRNAGQPNGTFEELFERAFQFLASPSKIWDLGSFEHRKLVLRLAFSERLAYCPENGFQTPKLSLPFRLLGGENMDKKAMAETEGFEPGYFSDCTPGKARPCNQERIEGS